MKKNLSEILRCPKCKKSALEIVEPAAREASDETAPVAGCLKCRSCGAGYKIENGIVVFIDEDN